MGPPIPDANHLARYCRPATFDDDGNPTYAAFLLRAATASRPGDEYLSAFLLEVLIGTTLEERLDDLQRELQAHRFLIPAKTGKHGVLNVGRTRTVVNSRIADKRWIRITVEQPPFFHAGIHDTASDEENVAKAIFDSALSYHPA